MLGDVIKIVASDWLTVEIRRFAFKARKDLGRFENKLNFPMAKKHGYNALWYSIFWEVVEETFLLEFLLKYQKKIFWR